MVLGYFMKLRIRNDSLRLRLTQSEVDRFAASGNLSDSVAFGPEPHQGLVYSIRMDQAARSINADITNNRIEIRVPFAAAAEWTGTKKVGLEADQDIGNGRFLNILIEKDFVRLKPRLLDDEIDKFPHPRAEDRNPH